MKLIQNILKKEEKYSDVKKVFTVGLKNEGSVGFPEGRYIFCGLMEYL